METKQTSPCFWGLSTRAQNILNELDIQTFAQLESLKPKDLLKVRNCGKKTVTEIRAFLQTQDRDLNVMTTVEELKAHIRSMEEAIAAQQKRIVSLRRELFELRTFDSDTR